MTRDRIAYVPRPKPPTPEGFPRRLEEAMTRRGLNQADLTRHLRLATGVVSRWLSGERGPNRANVVGISALLGVSVEELVGEDMRNAIFHGMIDEIPVERTLPGTEPPVGLKQALDAFEWPPGTTTSVVAGVSDALAKEAFAHRGSYIPPTHWRSRIAEELAARKGKRVEPPDDTPSLDEGESPEVREHRSKKKASTKGDRRRNADR